MRIAILASGSRGDVEPYVALGRGLARAGHVVRLVTHTNFESLVTAHGLEFWPVAGDVQNVAQGMAALLERGNFLAIMAEMGKSAEQGALALAHTGLAACRGVDLILAGIGGVYVGLALAEKLDLPLVQAYYIPFTPTRAYPSFLVPALPVKSATLNRLSYYAARQVMWQAFRHADNRARREVLAITAAPFFGPLNSERAGRYPILYGYSPSVIPPPPDWTNTVVTGYWFLEPPKEWAPPPKLRDFLAAGLPPVYIGFGSMSNRDPGATARLVLTAIAETGQRAVILSGWDGMAAADVPDSVYLLDGAPFAWLFPRMAAVVHHGGAGTTAAGLRAGVPSVVVPFFGDQPYWGGRVAALGAGPAPILRKRLTVERLAAAIEQAVNDIGMRQRAADLGTAIRAEDGVGCAVAAIEAHHR